MQITVRTTKHLIKPLFTAMIVLETNGLASIIELFINQEYSQSNRKSIKLPLY